MARAVGLAQRAVLNLAAVLGILSIIVTLLCLLLGIRPAVVISGSMEPEIPVGALTIARTVSAADVVVGDVVTVPRPDADGLVTHRVIEASPSEDGRQTVLHLQGDANSEPDLRPVVVSEVGRVLTSVPGLGHLVQTMQQNLLTVLSGLLVVAVLATLPVGRAGRASKG